MSQPTPVKQLTRLAGDRAAARTAPPERWSRAACSASNVARLHREEPRMTVDDAVTAPDSSVALTFFNDAEARAVEAISERIIPDGGDGAGATSAGVVYYIDRSVSGISRNLQHVYRTGLRALERYCAQQYSAQYVDLPAEQQDDVIRRFFGPEVVD